jgi:aspartyl-tRNA synthetase
MYKKSHSCGELRKFHIGQSVNLNGWVNTVRLHGKVAFVDLRDRYGKTQVVFDTESFSDDFEAVKKLSMEDVLSVQGTVRNRDEAAINPKMGTGEIEVGVSKYILLNEASPLPFVLSDRNSAEEDLRLKYRYLELRIEDLQKNLLIRHDAYQTARSYLSKNNFVEVETPMLMKSTPEGARDYLVPSRIHPGKFYALPQSPQIYKQILMISGLDRYFQIVKCFRDEDLRADRQPEFTQIDIEMSFVDEEDIFFQMEGLTRHIFKMVRDIDLPDPFPMLTYAKAMETYGSDKPDLRFKLALKDMKEFSDTSEFNAFKSTETVKGLVVAGGAKYSRKIIDELTELTKKYKAKGLAWMKGENDGLAGGISKFFSDDLQKKMCKKLCISNDDILFMIGDDKMTTLTALGALRNEISRRENLAGTGVFKPVWVTEFPMFEYDQDKDR